ncbi:sphingomyelin synthase [Mortierella antarctica]|nr:sphingomyelin synthase [Mortierella antarctica]
MTSEVGAERLEHLSSSEAAIDTLVADHDHHNRHSNLTVIGTQAAPPPPSSIESNPQSSHTSVPVQSSFPSIERHTVKRSLWNRCINSEIGRLVCGAIYFVVVCIAMAFCNQFSDHRWVTTDYKDILLQDRGFDILPAMKDITPANVFVMTSVVFTLIGMALICPNWTARIIVLRRVLWVVGTLSVYRALTLSVTTMPTPKKNCEPAIEKGFGAMFLIALQMIPGTRQACTDDIFSGHTVFMVTCAIQWRLYCRNKWITYFSYIYITIGLFFVVATRLHYTVDVVLAIFITYAVWSLYIAMIDVVMEKEYFGLRRHYEKYVLFNNHCSNAQVAGHIDAEKELSRTNGEQESLANAFAARRAQLKYRMNRMRGPGIGYDRGEHDRVAFVPMQYNTWLTGAIRWCDGLDLRMRQSSTRSRATRWEDWVDIHRSKHASDTSSEDPLSLQKPEGDVETGLGRREMTQVSHPRDGTVGPMMLDSIRVVKNADEPSTAA